MLDIAYSTAYYNLLLLVAKWNCGKWQFEMSYFKIDELSLSAMHSNMKRAGDGPAADSLSVAVSQTDNNDPSWLTLSFYSNKEYGT